MGGDALVVKGLCLQLDTGRTEIAETAKSVDRFTAAHAKETGKLRVARRSSAGNQGRAWQWPNWQSTADLLRGLQHRHRPSGRYRRPLIVGQRLSVHLDLA
jgi:hypothetical protein